MLQLSKQHLKKSKQSIGDVQADDNSTERGGINELSAKPDSQQEIEGYYDNWARDYDQNLRDWNYQAPKVAAGLLKQEVAIESNILDAGCGTGLSGTALKDAGYQHIAFMDISQDSLDLAHKTGAYTALKQVNMQVSPLPYETDEFAGLQCVGVLTYAPDTDGILREFCRIVQSGGLVMFTQRDDLFAERHCTAVFQALEDKGLWSKVAVSDPQTYLPNTEDYGNRIHAIYCTFRVI